MKIRLNDSNITFLFSKYLMWNNIFALRNYIFFSNYFHSISQCFIFTNLRKTKTNIAHIKTLLQNLWRKYLFTKYLYYIYVQMFVNDKETYKKRMRLFNFNIDFTCILLKLNEINSILYLSKNNTKLSFSFFVLSILQSISY